MRKLFEENNFTVFYIVLFAVIFPLFITNYYYNIQISKSLFFMILTMVFFVVVLVLAVLSFNLADVGKKLSTPVFLFFSFFMLCAFLSAMFSPYRNLAFTGKNSRYIGFPFLISCIFCLVIPVMTPKLEARKLHLPFLIGAVLVSAIGMLNFLDLDIFGLVSAVPEALRGRYLSTIGYVNFFSEYISLMCILGCGYYCLSRERYILPVLFLLYLMLILTNSDGGILAFAAGVLLSPVLLRKDRKALLRLPIALAPFVPALGAARLIFEFYPVHMAPEGVVNLLIQPYFLIAAAVFIVLLVLLCILLDRFTQPEREGVSKIFLISWLSFLGLCVLAVLVLLILSNNGVLPENALTFGDSFANNRGYIWTRLLKIFAEAPFVRKLTGYGPDTLKALLVEKLGNEMTQVTGQIFDSAHNCFLQYLLTVGILGTTGLFAGFGIILVRAFRNPEPDTLPFLLALVVYILQSFFVPSQPMVTPFCFLFAGLVLNGLQVHELGETEYKKPKETEVENPK